MRTEGKTRGNGMFQEKVGAYQEYGFCRYPDQRMNPRRVEKIPYGERYQKETEYW